ncbi:MAG TPA: amidohydrolase family protein [Candidatus Bathyarchaeia archaeon]|nr:amidohydrolase family protein [Candidatus Bathyarchaeia archaeon]
MSTRFDLVVKGGRVVDGTGMPSFSADVGVKDGRIAAIGRLDAPAERTLDADGLLVTPGFIDVHTHYDAQLDWDPTASPSSWHGVTTVLTGNCGFTLTPARPEDTGWLAMMLSRVEGMPADALAAGLRWKGGGFGDFWRRLQGRMGVNAGSYVGHSAVRRYVMGEAASERAATDAEIRAMEELVRAAMHEGALGFSTSQLDIHVAHDGRGVPSNHATAEEIVRLAGVLAEFGCGAIEFIPRSFAEGTNPADRKLLLDMYRASGRPIEIQPLNILPSEPDGWQRTLEFAHEAFAEGARIHPMFACNKISAHLSLGTTFLFDEIPSFRETLTKPSPERERLLRDRGVRDRMRRELADPTGRAFAFVWEVFVVEAVRNPAHARHVGKSVAELAAAEGKDPLDFFLDLSLAEDLETQFVLEAPPSDYLRQLVASQIQDPIVMAGSSDGGAHLLSFVGADYTTRLITEWVPDTLSLEAAVHRLTLGPAIVHGISDRGILREGAKADILLIDRGSLAAGRTHLVRDLPGGCPRLVVDAQGYVATVVNGTVLLENGKHTGATPGEFVRPGA